MKKAKVSELKAHLSSYLAEVRSGETIVVCDRNTPIARIVPNEDEGLRIREPTQPPGALKDVRGVRLRRPVRVARVLRIDRDQR